VLGLAPGWAVSACAKSAGQYEDLERRRSTNAVFGRCDALWLRESALSMERISDAK
jgi:hypothetical protein